jgi:uracil-DNA glycosylase
MSVGLKQQAAAESLYARVRACTGCPLSGLREKAVPGEGPLDAEILFIGEAPGMNEDKQGRPFVGAAGKFLDECLGAAGLTRGDVYICNVLKCRPPSNRDPLPGEIEACRDFLDEQVALVDPLVIVTLGRFSMARFFPNHKIGAVHGRWKEVDGRFYVPMYHPAAALHQGGLRATILEDFRRLPKVVDRARSQRADSHESGGKTMLEERPAADPPSHPDDGVRNDTISEAEASLTQFRLFD